MNFSVEFDGEVSFVQSFEALNMDDAIIHCNQFCSIYQCKYKNLQSV